MAIHLDLSQLNVVISIFGFWIAAFGFISVKFKSHWYLGEARTSASLSHFTNTSHRLPVLRVLT
jgi:hypothetical protein